MAKILSRGTRQAGEYFVDCETDHPNVVYRFETRHPDETVAGINAVPTFKLYSELYNFVEHLLSYKPMTKFVRSVRLHSYTPPDKTEFIKIAENDIQHMRWNDTMLDVQMKGLVGYEWVGQIGVTVNASDEPTLNYDDQNLMIRKTVVKGHKYVVMSERVDNLRAPVKSTIHFKKAVSNAKKFLKVRDASEVVKKYKNSLTEVLKTAVMKSEELGNIPYVRGNRTTGNETMHHIYVTLATKYPDVFRDVYYPKSDNVDQVLDGIEQYQNMKLMYEQLFSNTGGHIVYPHVRDTFVVFSLKDKSNSTLASNELPDGMKIKIAKLRMQHDKHVALTGVGAKIIEERNEVFFLMEGKNV